MSGANALAAAFSLGAGLAGAMQVAVMGRFGLFGLERIPLTAHRVLGIVLLAAGALLALRR